MKKLLKSKGIILFLLFMILIANIQEQSIKKDSSTITIEMSQMSNVNN